MRKFKALCEDWNVILKEEKDSAPAQKMIALGIEYDLLKMTKRVTDKRRDDIKADLVAARTTNNIQAPLGTSGRCALVRVTVRPC